MLQMLQAHMAQKNVQKKKKVNIPDQRNSLASESSQKQSPGSSNTGQQSHDLLKHETILYV